MLRGVLTTFNNQLVNNQAQFLTELQQSLTKNSFFVNKSFAVINDYQLANPSTREDFLKKSAKIQNEISSVTAGDTQQLKKIFEEMIALKNNINKVLSSSFKPANKALLSEISNATKNKEITSEQVSASQLMNTEFAIVTQAIALKKRSSENQISVAPQTIDLMETLLNAYNKYIRIKMASNDLNEKIQTLSHHFNAMQNILTLNELKKIAADNKTSAQTKAAKAIVQLLEGTTLNPTDFEKELEKNMVKLHHYKNTLLKEDEKATGSLHEQSLVVELSMDINNVIKLHEDLLKKIINHQYLQTLTKNPKDKSIDAFIVFRDTNIKNMLKLMAEKTQEIDNLMQEKSKNTQEISRSRSLSASISSLFTRSRPSPSISNSQKPPSSSESPKPSRLQRFLTRNKVLPSSDSNEPHTPSSRNPFKR